MGATDDIAQAAARLVVDDGLEYGAAKRKADNSPGWVSARNSDR
jgi:hypothetical protein